MKRLTKLNLENLASNMEKMAENESKTTIGGERYYTDTGQYLGKVGESDQILVTTSQVYDQYHYDPNTLNRYSCCMTESNQQAIITSIAASNGLTINYKGTGSSGVFFSPDPILLESGNYYDILCEFTGAIEDYFNQDKNLTTQELMINHYSAIARDPYNTNYEKASAIYRDHIEDKLEYWTNGGQIY